MIYAWKGTIVYSTSLTDISVYENSYVVCDNGVSAGVFTELPEQYKDCPVTDFGTALILPGFVDLHLHAPQYAFRGIRMDLEVVDWLNAYTFPHESKYEDTEYAKNAYRIFANDLKNSFTTRACIFGTIHLESTVALMSLLEETGLVTFVGRVSTDRNAPSYLTEKNHETSFHDTKMFLAKTMHAYKHSFPILTPRCTFFCSDEMMGGLRQIQLEYELPVQSHLSENPRRLEQLRALYPGLSCDGEAYDHFGLFGSDYPAVMAHCIHGPEQEVRLLSKRNVFVAHCPESNMNISSGIAPIRRYLEDGVKVGLGSDVAGGANISLLYVMALAIQASKMYWRYLDSDSRPLTVGEVFHMATLGGGALFGNVGSFKEGYEFDALVLSDEDISDTIELQPLERLERMLYLNSSVKILAKSVQGRIII